MTPSEILMKHEDANEYHFHEVDRKWIIEAMEEYATISKMETTQTAVEWLHNQWENEKEWSWKKIESWFKQAKQMEKNQIIEAFLVNYSQILLETPNPENEAEEYYNEEYKNKKVL